MHRLTVLATLLIIGCASQTVVADRRDSIRETDQRRFQAMVRNDLEALAPMLAEDLVYIHSDGVAESKPQFLEKLRSGALRYRSIAPADVIVRPYGNFVIVTGLLNVDVTNDGADRKLLLRYTAVYRGHGNGWQLISWQSTRMP